MGARQAPAGERPDHGPYPVGLDWDPRPRGGRRGLHLRRTPMTQRGGPPHRSRDLQRSPAVEPADTDFAPLQV